MLGGALPAYVGLVRTRPLYVVVLAALDEALRTSAPPIGLWLDTPAQTVEAILAGRERVRVL